MRSKILCRNFCCTSILFLNKWTEFASLRFFERNELCGCGPAAHWLTSQLGLSAANPQMENRVPYFPLIRGFSSGFRVFNTAVWSLPFAEDFLSILHYSTLKTSSFKLSVCKDLEILSWPIRESRYVTYFATVTPGKYSTTKPYHPSRFSLPPFRIQTFLLWAIFNFGSQLKILFCLSWRKIVIFWNVLNFATCFWNRSRIQPFSKGRMHVREPHSINL